MEQAGFTPLWGSEKEGRIPQLWRSPLRSEGSQPHSPGSPCQDTCLITSGCQNQRRLWLSEMEGCWSPRDSSQMTYKGTYPESLTLSSSNRTPSPKGPETYLGNWYWDWGKWWRGSFLPDKSAGRSHCSTWLVWLNRLVLQGRAIPAQSFLSPLFFQVSNLPWD